VKAIQFYEESYEIHKSRKGKDAKREMALTLNRLGSLTRELGRYDEVSICLVTDYVDMSLFDAYSQHLISCCPFLTFPEKAMDYHQKALNIQKSSSGAGKAMAAETCVLMGMVKARMGSFKSALNVRA